MSEWIDYALVLPPGRPGELVGKTVSRILKHAFKATRVRVQLFNHVRRVTARVDKRHLESIRGAVRMAMESKQLSGPLIVDPNTTGAFGKLPPTTFRRLDLNAGREQSTAGSDGDRGARPEEAVQAQPGAAPDEPPAVA